MVSTLGRKDREQIKWWPPTSGKGLQDRWKSDPSDSSSGVQEYLLPPIPEEEDFQRGVERVSRKAALKSAQNTQPS